MWGLEYKPVLTLSTLLGLDYISCVRVIAKVCVMSISHQTRLSYEDVDVCVFCGCVDSYIKNLHYNTLATHAPQAAYFRIISGKSICVLFSRM